MTTNNLVMFHNDAAEGLEIVPVRTVGTLEVYRRLRHRVWHLPKYVVFHDGRALEDFRTLRGALAWARRNKNG